MAGPICWLRSGHLQLLWAPQNACPVQPGVVAFATDDKVEFSYDPFNRGRDFGPLDLAATVIYCRWQDALQESHGKNSWALVHVAAEPRGCWSNTVTLCGAYLVLAKGFSAAAAFQPFAQLELVHFVDCRGDAACTMEDGEPDFQLSVLDVLSGLQHARDLGWINYRTFPVEIHSSMLRPEHGDMSWLLEGKALAMASPWARPTDTENLPVCTPEALVPYFLHNKVGMVIQCNHPQSEEKGQRRELLAYDPRLFECAGIRHIWLPFEDGGCPSVEIILRFLKAVESAPGAFAVHCRSGLGRTATLIGAYAIRFLGFTARSFIGWCRVVRPGTVHGSQQQYLVNLEPYLRKNGPELTSLGPVEQLQLLPRRELRFWALDLGIAPEETAHLPDQEVIQMILARRNQQEAPVDHTALRPPDPAVNRQSSGALPLEVASLPPAVQVAAVDPTEAAGLADGPSSPISTELPGDLWGETMRYLRLLARKDDAWDKVAQMLERLKLRSQNGERLPVDHAPHALLASKQQVMQETQRREAELEKLHLELREVQKGCSQLRLNIAMRQDTLAQVPLEQLEDRLQQLRGMKEHREAECLQEQQALRQAKAAPGDSAKRTLESLRMRLTS